MLPPHSASLNPPHPNPLPPKRGEREKAAAVRPEALPMWPVLAPLWRTLRGGRPDAARGPYVYSFEADWAGVVAELGLPPRALRDVAANGSLDPHFRYRRFHRPKRDGTWREIAEPDPRLKRLPQEGIAPHFAGEE